MDITFTVSKEMLEKAVSRIITVCERPAASGGNVLPYFFHIRIDGYGSALKLSAGNAVRNIEILIKEVSEHTPFCFGVYGYYFYNILKAMPCGDLSFALRDVCYMYNGSSTLKFQILAANQFPSDRVVAEHEWWEVDYKELFSRLKKIIYCVDTKGTINRSYVKAVHISPESFACTDNRRMSIVPNGIVPYTGRALIPEESVSVFASIFDSDSSSGFIYIDDNCASFSQGNVHAVTRLLGYDAPVFESVVPKGPCLSCEIDRMSIMMALKRAVIVAKKDSKSDSLHPVSISFSSGKLRLSLDNNGFAITENLDVKYSGPDTVIHVSLILLFQAIKNITDDNICIEMRGDTTPIIITDSKGVHKNVIMPVLVR